MSRSLKKNKLLANEFSLPLYSLACSMNNTHEKWCPAPNYLHERSKDELTERAIGLFVAVAIERDRAKRFQLQSKRDLLLHELKRIGDAEVKAKALVQWWKILKPRRAK